MILLFITSIVYVLAPWIAAAIVAGVGVWHLAIKHKGGYAFLAVLMVCVGGLATPKLLPFRAQQTDSLHFKEATAFCESSQARVLKPIAVAAELSFGVYDSYLGPGEFKDLEFDLRSRQTSPDSGFRNVKFVALKRGEQPAQDVYPILRHAEPDQVNLSVIDPNSGEIVAYSNYLRHENSERRLKFRYVGCNREASDGLRKLESDELFALLGALNPQIQQISPEPLATTPARKRKYDVEADTQLEVRSDCSKGLTLAPGLNHAPGYQYMRSGDDLIVLVMHKDLYEAAEKRKLELARLHQRSVLWQHYYPVIACKDYLVDDSKAGPIFHAGGYKEPVARVRAFANTSFHPFDYGPHKVMKCDETIVTGLRRPSDLVLKREGSDLEISEVWSPFDTLLITPLLMCKGYFNSPLTAPDIRAENKGPASSRIAYSATQILALRDGEYLAHDAPRVARMLSEPPKLPDPTRRPAPNQEASESSKSPWPAKPRPELSKGINR